MNVNSRNENLGCWVTITVIVAGIGFALWYFYDPIEPRPNPYRRPVVTVNIRDTTICSMDTLELYAYSSTWSRHSIFSFPNVKWTFVYDSTTRVANERQSNLSLVPTPSLKMVVCEVTDDTGNVARDTCIVRVIEVGASRTKGTNSLTGFIRSRDPYSVNWQRVIEGNFGGKLVKEATDGFSLSYEPANSGTYILSVRDELTGCKCYSNPVQIE
jgi:hypothetical protein